MKELKTTTRDNRTLFKSKRENYYKLVRVGNGKSYIGNESNGDKNKTLSVNKYLDKIKSYLRKINLRKSDLTEIQFTIAINFYVLQGQWWRVSSAFKGC